MLDLFVSPFQFQRILEPHFFLPDWKPAPALGGARAEGRYH